MALLGAAVAWSRGNPSRAGIGRRLGDNWHAQSRFAPLARFYVKFHYALRAQADQLLLQGFGVPVAGVEALLQCIDRARLIQGGQNFFFSDQGGLFD